MLNGWLVILINLRRLVKPLECLSLIHLLFMLDHIVRNNLYSLVLVPLNQLNVVPLCMIIIKHLTTIPILKLILLL